ncbi:ExbD/TolR family protein [Aliiroseovarius sp. PTFE2010]
MPMINVVFLLLIFFMISARIAPAPPFDLSLPVSQSETVLEEDMTLYISSENVVGFRGAVGADAWAALQTLNTQQRLTIRADADLPTPELAKVLARLAGIGLKTVDLAVGRP